MEVGSKKMIERDYVQIYHLLYGHLTGARQEAVKVEDAGLAVKRWFQSQEERWLVALNSADSINNEQDQSYIDLNYFLPGALGMYVIITS